MTTTITQEFPMDLCELLQTLSLTGGTKLNQKVSDIVESPKRADVQEDVTMSDDPSCQSDKAKSEYSNTSTKSESYGCAYLRAIQAQLDTYPTTGGEYLEAIFTHREILSSYPQAHQECARGFSDLAYMLEQRAWRADRDADVEAVVAFRYEAWSIALSAGPSPAKSAPVCVMQPAW